MLKHADEVGAKETYLIQHMGVRETQQEQISQGPKRVAPASVVGGGCMQQLLYMLPHASKGKGEATSWVREHFSDVVRAMGGFPRPAKLASGQGVQPTSHEPGSVSRATQHGSTPFARVHGGSHKGNQDWYQWYQEAQETAVPAQEGQGYVCMSKRKSAIERFEPRQSVLSDPVEVGTQTQQQQQQQKKMEDM